MGLESLFFFSSRRRHTRSDRDWSSDVCSSDLGRFGGRGAFGSYEAACASPDVDAVLICTPHALHVEHTRLAAAHKKPMLIEKPVARTLAELAEIEAASCESGVPCMVAQNYFFKPVVQVLQDHLHRCDIGD